MASTLGGAVRICLTPQAGCGWPVAAIRPGDDTPVTGARTSPSIPDDPNTRRRRAVQATAKGSTIKYSPPGASRSTPCELSALHQLATAQEHVMKAIVQDKFGPPDVLELREVDEPQVGDG